MNELAFVEDIKIENMIYGFRDMFVMLDSDLAKLYGCKNGTKEINQAVKRNVDRFPNDFYFQITKEEFEYLKSHFVTSSWNNYAGKELFDILRNINVDFKIYTKNIDGVLIKKYNSQYNNITIINSDVFHDRLIIIDKSFLYHCGSSFKDLGRKCFGINRIEDTSILKSIINKL